MYLRDEGIEKADQYYQKALKFAKCTQSDDLFVNSSMYDIHYKILNKALTTYEFFIKKYNVKSNCDLDKEIYDAVHYNYREAQQYARDVMISQVKNLLRKKKYIAARKMAKEIIDICEEREKNIKEKGIKLSLKNAYELLLKIPGLTKNDKSIYEEKLTNLLKTMQHDDFYCKDGTREFRISPR